MMADLHINDFYKDCGLIFIALYQYFPKPITLYIEDISGPDNVDQYGLHSDRHLRCLGAFLWLQEEGYIRFEQQVKQLAFDHCRLSHKALSLLTQSRYQGASDTAQPLPVSVAVERSNRINQMRSAIDNQDSTAIANIVRNLLFDSK